MHGGSPAWRRSSVARWHGPARVLRPWRTRTSFQPAGVLEFVPPPAPFAKSPSTGMPCDLSHQNQRPTTGAIEHPRVAGVRTSSSSVCPSPAPRQQSIRCRKGVHGPDLLLIATQGDLIATQLRPPRCACRCHAHNDRSRRRMRSTSRRRKSSHTQRPTSAGVDAHRVRKDL